ncbi:MAG: phenylalanine--tRNA ligase subunit beta [Rickettsiales bacterium]|jgi:phenylalanyl-tRNA synthetase beta chain|nr:phenylalanine--tRNA ligase subunit beta [Rickettsiales bacterium]
MVALGNMKITLSWLKEYLETDATLEEISAVLNRIGLEVEEIVDRSKELKDFNCVIIEESVKHPDSDHLQVCRVRVSNNREPITVVCGAHNARAGLRTVLAPVGSLLPGNPHMKVEKIRIRGIESNGMLCSEKELGLGEEHDGIVELDKNTVLSTNVADIFHLSDPLVEISITPNRGDCLGVYGIARDLSAANVGKLKKLGNFRVTETKNNTHSITVSDRNCPLFAFREVTGLKNCKSPEWLKSRLESIGLKSRNALVDIGNYIMFSFNRPMHFYDMAKIEGNLVVRASEKDEEFVDLFGNNHKLPAGASVICDEKKILCLGGIIGSSSSSIDENTRDVLIESAVFDPINTAATGRFLNLQTDARYRFERGSDCGMINFSLDYASRLVEEICGGNFSNIVSYERNGYRESETRNIRLNFDGVEKRLGLKIDRKIIVKILKALGYGVSSTKDFMNLTVPSHRTSIECAEDVIDDIIRIYGYENLRDGDFMDANVYEKKDNLFHKKFEESLHRVRKKLVSDGLVELITYSFTNREDSSYFSELKDELDLINPITSDFSHMRQNMLPNMLNALVKNGNRGYYDLSFFEIGHVYNSCAIDNENTIICGVRYGKCGVADFYGESRYFDIFDAKGNMLDIAAIFGFNVDGLSVGDDTPKYYHPGRSGTILFGKTVLGYFGELHPAVVAKFALKNRPIVFEFFVDNVPKKLVVEANLDRGELVANDLQSVKRDLSFIVDDDRRVGDILKDVREINRATVARVYLFDVYRQDGKKSIGITLEIQPHGRAMEGEEIDALCGRVVDFVSKKYGGVLRDGSVGH